MSPKRSAALAKPVRMINIRAALWGPEEAGAAEGCRGLQGAGTLERGTMAG